MIVVKNGIKNVTLNNIDSIDDLDAVNEKRKRIFSGDKYTSDEMMLVNHLKALNIPFIAELDFNGFVTEIGLNYRYDFGIIKEIENVPTLVAVVEVDGTGHQLTPNWIEIDKIKDDYLKSIDIPLIRLSHTDLLLCSKAIHNYFKECYETLDFYDIRERKDFVKIFPTIDDNLKVINDVSSAERFKNCLTRKHILKGDDVLMFSNVPGFQKYITCKVKDLVKRYDEIKEYHYMSITANNFPTSVYDKMIRAFCVLIDVDANNESDRDSAILYAKEHYKGKIISIIQKSPKPVNQKHHYGCHILIMRDENFYNRNIYNNEDYLEIHKDFTDKFDFIDKTFSFSCIKNPMYKYFFTKKTYLRN